MHLTDIVNRSLLKVPLQFVAVVCCIYASATKVNAQSRTSDPVSTSQERRLDRYVFSELKEPTRVKERSTQEINAKVVKHDRRQKKSEHLAMQGIRQPNSLLPEASANLSPETSEIVFAVDTGLNHPERNKHASHDLTVSRAIDLALNSPMPPREWRTQTGRTNRLLTIDSREAIEVSLIELLDMAIQHSPKVAIQELITMQEYTDVLVEESQFDWKVYSEFLWVDENLPVSNRLDTGNDATRKLSQTSNIGFGIGRQLEQGGSFQVTQSFGTLFSNSSFLTPPNQGNARFLVRYTHPLLRGSGANITLSRIATATVNAEITAEIGRLELQQHMTRIAELYWNLYGARELYRAAQWRYEQAQNTLARFESRLGLSLRAELVSQMRRNVSREESAVAEAMMVLLEQQHLLVEAIGFPEWQLNRIEIVPADRFALSYASHNPQDEIRLALVSRPEMRAIAKKQRNGIIAQRLAEDLLLPQLDLIVDGYMAGVNGNFNVGDSFVDQFSEGRPSYSVGLRIDIPLGNREAIALNNRSSLELSKLRADIERVSGSIIRDVHTALVKSEWLAELCRARTDSLNASSEELRQIKERENITISDPEKAETYLNRMLQARRRFANSQEELIQTQVEYMHSQFNLLRANGTLVQDFPNR